MKKIFVSLIILLILSDILTAHSILKEKSVCIAVSGTPTLQEVYAAREIRRYLYLRTGVLIPVASCELSQYPKDRDLILIGSSSSKPVMELLIKNKLQNPLATLKEQSFWLKTVADKKRKILLISGKDDAGTLRGAYKLMESFGVRYTLNEDIIPDKTIPLYLPDLNVISSPCFDIRGNFPYFCNPEGPDNWNANAFKAFITQQAKMGMNFIGLRNDWAMKHLWKGIPEDLNEDGSIKFAYKTWLREIYPAAEAPFGADKAFKSDIYVTDSYLKVRDLPDNLEKQIQIHEANGQLLKEAFMFASKLGIYTCVGSEVPITSGVPKSLSDHVKEITGKEVKDLEYEFYKGTFLRTMKLLDPDYYWLNTNEKWIWNKQEDVEKEIPSAVNSFKTAIEVKKDLGCQI